MASVWRGESGRGAEAAVKDCRSDTYRRLESGYSSEGKGVVGRGTSHSVVEESLCTESGRTFVRDCWR